MIRISAGKYRSRNIEVPPSTTVPTKSIVRTALSNATNNIVRGAYVLDLFAGSGALGIEALSRGASFCHFVDIDEKACEIIKKNLDSLKEEKARIHNANFKDALFTLKNEGKTFDIVFLDPPYAMKEAYLESIGYLLANEMVNKGGCIVAEFEGELGLPINLFNKYKEYTYGRTKVAILWR